LKNFEYNGLSWYKTKFDQIDVYYTKLPVIYKGHHYLNYNLYFRNDPRENDVSAEVDAISLWPEIVISVDPEAWDCTGMKKSYGDIGSFLSSFPYVQNLTGAYSDVDEAERMGEAFADCSNSSGNKTIILYSKSDVPSIVQDAEYPDCYRINVGQCESVKATEKFILEFIRELEIEKVE
jgi:hypothetical protein